MTTTHTRRRKVAIILLGALVAAPIIGTVAAISADRPAVPQAPAPTHGVTAEPTGVTTSAAAAGWEAANVHLGAARLVWDVTGGNGHAPLRAGDRVTGMNGAGLTQAAAARAAAALAGGEQVTLTVERSGRSVDVEVRSNGARPHLPAAVDQVAGLLDVTLTRVHVVGERPDIAAFGGLDSELGYALAYLELLAGEQLTVTTGRVPAGSIDSAVRSLCHQGADAPALCATVARRSPAGELAV